MTNRRLLLTWQTSLVVALAGIAMFVPTGTAEDSDDIPECLDIDQDASSGWPSAGDGQPWVWIDEFNHVHIFVPTGGVDNHQTFYGTEVTITCSLECLTDDDDITDCIPG